jgi:hypothetical protein
VKVIYQPNHLKEIAAITNNNFAPFRETAMPVFDA